MAILTSSVDKTTDNHHGNPVESWNWINIFWVFSTTALSDSDLKNDTWVVRAESTVSFIEKFLFCIIQNENFGSSRNDGICREFP